MFTPSRIEFRRELANYLCKGDVSQLERTKDGYRYYFFTLNLDTKKEFAKIYGFDSVS